MHTQQTAVAILKEICGLCASFLGMALKEGYLYGSYARGDYNENSDIDILLALDLTQEEIQKYRRLVASIASDISLKYDITVSVSMKSQKQFEDASAYVPFYQNVIREGLRYAVS